VDYFNVLTSQLMSSSTIASISRPESCEAQVSDFFLDRERNRLITAEAMVEARALADASKIDQAKVLLTDTITKLKSTISAEDKQTLEYIKDLNDAHGDMVSKEQYHQIGSKKMMWKEQKMGKQRAAADSDEMDLMMKKKMKMAYIQQKEEKQKQISAPQPTASTLSMQQPTATTSSTTVPQPAVVPANRKALQIGNTHTSIPEDQAEESKITPGVKLLHEWTLYVRGTDLAFVDKVVFNIHHSFTPNVITVTNAPFEITRKGWGFFNTKVEIHYKPGMGPQNPTSVIHELSFEGNGNFQEVVVNL